MSRPIRTIATVLLVLLALSTARSQKPNSTNFTIKVDVDLTLLNVTVADTQDRRVTGLQAQHFQVWEDKIEQQIEYFSSEEMPVSLGILLDVSGSMEDKISAAKNAVVTFLKIGNPEDEYFLIQFNDQPYVVQDFTKDITELQDRVIFTRTKGMTAMYDAAYKGLEKLNQSKNPKKALLLITDGEDNHSRYTAANIKEYLKEQDVQIFAIGILSRFGPGGVPPGRAILEELTKISGGRAFFPDSPHDLEDICTKIAIELRNQYVFGYRSRNPNKDGKWRKIRVKVNPPPGSPRLAVHAKSGYYAQLKLN